MKPSTRFPKILTSENNKGFEGLAGLKLKSVLKADLILEQ